MGSTETAMARSSHDSGYPPGAWPSWNPASTPSKPSSSTGRRGRRTQTSDLPVKTNESFSHIHPTTFHHHVFRFDRSSTVPVPAGSSASAKASPTTPKSAFSGWRTLLILAALFSQFIPSLLSTSWRPFSMKPARSFPLRMTANGELYNSLLADDRRRAVRLAPPPLRQHRPAAPAPGFRKPSSPTANTTGSAASAQGSEITLRNVVHAGNLSCRDRFIRTTKLRQVTPPGQSPSPWSPLRLSLGTLSRTCSGQADLFKT